MTSILIDLPDEQATEITAQQFAGVVSIPLVIGLMGEIGAGKTTFLRAMFRAIGIKGAIKSPTYALVESYTLKDLQIHHFDLYRIHDEAELEFIGFRDYFMTPALCCIEWPLPVEKGQDYLDILLQFSTKGMGRLLQLNPVSPRGVQVVSSFIASVSIG